MKLVLRAASALLVVTTLCSVRASESATDCTAAVETFRLGLAERPDDALALFLDALRTNPGCRRSLLATAVESVAEEPLRIQDFVYVARQEFPGEQTSFAEAVLSVVPQHADLIRDAFLADAEAMSTALAEAEEKNTLVELPEEALALDEELREAIARMTAKVEGKDWPEQELDGDPVHYRHRDEVRVSRSSYGADERSLENAIPIDTHDERKLHGDELRINDHWEREGRIRLDESKFASSDSTEMREARKREISPAGAIGVPKAPYLRRSSYYIPPAKGDYRSSIDLDDTERPTLIIRPPSAFRSVPEKPESED